MAIDESFKREIERLYALILDLETEAIHLDAFEHSGEHAQALTTALAQRLASMLVTLPTPVRVTSIRPRPNNVPRFERPGPRVDDVIGQLTSVVGTNSGHGHVWKRPDGLIMAGCGGPDLCSECKIDASLVEHSGRSGEQTQDQDGAE